MFDIVKWMIRAFGKKFLIVLESDSGYNIIKERRAVDE